MTNLEKFTDVKYNTDYLTVEHTGSGHLSISFQYEYLSGLRHVHGDIILDTKTASEFVLAISQAINEAVKYQCNNMQP